LSRHTFQDLNEKLEKVITNFKKENAYGELSLFERKEYNEGLKDESSLW
jgi:hypothetical protein